MLFGPLTVRTVDDACLVVVIVSGIARSPVQSLAVVDAGDELDVDLVGGVVVPMTGVPLPKIPLHAPDAGVCDHGTSSWVDEDPIIAVAGVVVDLKLQLESLTPRDLSQLTPGDIGDERVAW